jgi:hypothetical protein
MKIRITIFLSVLLAYQVSAQGPQVFEEGKENLPTDQRNTGTSQVDEEYLDEGPVRTKVQREEELYKHDDDRNPRNFKFDPYIDNEAGEQEPTKNIDPRER